MKKFLNLHSSVLIINGLVIAAIFVLNYFYQKHGFAFTLKCVCSIGFTIVGLINFGYATLVKQENIGFFISMLLGLFLAMLGDIVINYSFILGAGLFALGHIGFLIAYCFVEKVKHLEIIICLVIFTGALLFLLFCPLLKFDVPLFRWVCIVYAFIISFMLGKAIGNMFYKKDLFTIIIALGSFLFFFSDLMLVFDWFIGLWNWTSEVCMATYYPALCLLAFSMYLKTRKDKELSK